MSLRRSIATASALLLALGYNLALAQGTTASSQPKATPPHAGSPAAGGTGATAAGGKTSRDTDAGKLSGSDRKFVEKAAMGGMAEVQLGQLAQEKASNDQVKAFGKRMQEDHSKANDELKSLASAKGVPLPAGVGREHQHAIDKLSRLSGDKFDREYMEHMVKDHKKDVSEFRKESKDAKDTDLKGFASKTLPTLEEHLRLAQTTHDAVKGRGSSKK